MPAGVSLSHCPAAAQQSAAAPQATQTVTLRLGARTGPARHRFEHTFTVARLGRRHSTGTRLPGCGGRGGFGPRLSTACLRSRAQCSPLQVQVEALATHRGPNQAAAEAGTQAAPSGLYSVALVRPGIWHGRASLFIIRVRRFNSRRVPSKPGTPAALQPGSGSTDPTGGGVTRAALLPRECSGDA